MRGLTFKLALSLVFLSGCYTIVKHPEVTYTSSSGEVYTSQISYRSNCYECHTSAELEYYDFARAHRSFAWSYFNTPWWIVPPSSTFDSSAVNVPPTPERTRGVGSHRGSSSGFEFSTPPPSRTGSGTSTSNGGQGGKDSSSLGKSSTPREQQRVDSTSTENKRESQPDKKEERRNIGPRRK